MKKENKKQTSFEKWMVFFILLSLFVFIQGQVFRSTISYEHLDSTTKEFGYSACQKEAGLSRTECDAQFTEGIGKSMNDASKEILDPFYYGTPDMPGVLGILYNWTGSWFGSWWLIITLIATVALILKLRKNTKSLVEKSIKILKIESILLLIAGCLSYLLFLMIFSPFFVAGGIGGYEAVQLGMGYIISILSPIGYQILASIMLLVLVFVINKY